MHKYPKLALDAIRHYLDTDGEEMELSADVSDELRNTRSAVFVSLHKEPANKLRGCIGTLEPTEDCLGRQIIRYAIQAAFHDERFDPVDESEVGSLDISVDVLSEPESCGFADLDPRKYGIIVSVGDRSGVLLPDLPGVDTVAEQVGIACQKAGIGMAEIGDSISNLKIQRFEVKRYH